MILRESDHEATEAACRSAIAQLLADGAHICEKAPAHSAEHLCACGERWEDRFPVIAPVPDNLDPEEG